MKETFFQLPESDRKRLVRNEYTLLMRMMCELSTLSFIKDEMRRRLDMVPNGYSRVCMAHGQVLSLVNDIIGTIPDEQKDIIRHSMEDNEVRIVPKNMPDKIRLTVEAKDLGYLFDLARPKKCEYCTENSKECRKCELYKLHTKYIPLESYDTIRYCPYNLQKWGD